MTYWMVFYLLPSLFVSQISVIPLVSLIHVWATFQEPSQIWHTGWFSLTLKKCYIFTFHSRHSFQAGVSVQQAILRRMYLPQLASMDVVLFIVSLNL